MAYVPRVTVPEGLHRRTNLFKGAPRFGLLFRLFLSLQKIVQDRNLVKNFLGAKWREASLAEPGQDISSAGIGIQLQLAPISAVVFSIEGVPS
jgi:hypothetical protein